MIPMVWPTVVPLIYKLFEPYLVDNCVWHETDERGARGIVKDKKLARGGKGRDVFFKSMFFVLDGSVLIHRTI